MTVIFVLAEMMEKKSRAKWGNKIGYALVPLFIGLQENPLDYIRKAKATIDRKKLSMESRFSFTSARILLKLFGVQAAAALITRVICNTTVSISNVVGPQEEISFFGHTMVFSAPIVYGVPHSLTILFQSYCNKMTISMAVDPEVIPDPYQLCDDLEESLVMSREAVLTTSTLHALP
ncbi:O-acyltransferase WSD1-like [Ipomoea triloba]|uniref:O-acyltransferase WSD1-like n=1 Tax=Ipomoea triloba TaxID=35885 RepID=UPI00125CFF53|nr:O-acyltransferase WSD1-like [Ipomoea triloba]